MAKFKRFVKSGRMKWLAVGLSLVSLTAAVVGLSVKVSKQETTKELGASAYAIGLLDDETGKIPTGDGVEVDKGGLATTKFYDVDGLKVEVAKNATVKYQVNYYDEEKKFLAVQTLTDDFDSANIPSTASTAEYVKIEIIPTDDDDGEVSLLEKSGYVKQVTVTVAK